MVWSQPMTRWNTAQFMRIEYPNSDKIDVQKKKLAIKLSKKKNKTVKNVNFCLKHNS